MVVTATELKNNLGHYLEVAKDEVVVITRNGSPCATLNSLARGRVERMESLFGILPEDVTLEEARDIRYGAHGLGFDETEGE